MENARVNNFPHRRNWDGTFDSICPSCFVTIATKDSETELAAAEAAHICDRYYGWDDDPYRRKSPLPDSAWRSMTLLKSH